MNKLFTFFSLNYEEIFLENIPEVSIYKTEEIVFF